MRASTFTTRLAPARRRWLPEVGLALCLLLAGSHPAMAAASMQDAVKELGNGLVESLFGRPAGQIRWLQGPREVIATFEGRVSETGSEFVVQRQTEGSGFAKTIGLLRVIET